MSREVRKLLADIYDLATEALSCDLSDRTAGLAVCWHTLEQIEKLSENGSSTGGPGCQEPQPADTLAACEHDVCLRCACTDGTDSARGSLLPLLEFDRSSLSAR